MTQTNEKSPALQAWESKQATATPDAPGIWFRRHSYELATTWRPNGAGPQTRAEAVAEAAKLAKRTGFAQWIATDRDAEAQLAVMPDGSTKELPRDSKLPRGKNAPDHSDAILRGGDAMARFVARDVMTFRIGGGR